MHRLSDYERQPRGPYLIDTWTARSRLMTSLGSLPIDLTCDITSIPSQEMVSRGQELAAFTQDHFETVLDLIYAHYRYAQSNGWLDFWDVPSGLARSDVLQQTNDIRLVVHQDLVAGIHVDPRWEQEHKLSLEYFDGAIRSIDGQRFEFVGGELFFPEQVQLPSSSIWSCR